ncbi:MAG TPA: hypothetical protein VIW94_06625 [Acidimicrobiia bacterium]
MESLDDLNRRLGQIQDELLALPADDYARKNELHAERDRLRSDAAQYQRDFDLDRPSSELIAELKQHRRQLESIEDEYINTAEQLVPGFGLAGEHGGPGDTQWINDNISEGTGRAAIEKRIAHLESILADRGHL